MEPELWVWATTLLGPVPTDPSSLALEAQMEEHSPSKRDVVGSSPTESTVREYRVKWLCTVNETRYSLTLSSTQGDRHD